MKMIHANLIVIVMWLSSIFFYVLITYPFDVVTMTLDENGKLPIKSNKVVAGENLTILMEFEKKMNCSPSIEYFLVDGFVLKLSENDITRPIGNNKFERQIQIPESAPIEQKVHIRIEYACELNKLRTVYYTWDTEDFEILAKEQHEN